MLNGISFSCKFSVLLLQKQVSWNHSPLHSSSSPPAFQFRTRHPPIWHYSRTILWQHPDSSSNIVQMKRCNYWSRNCLELTFIPASLVSYLRFVHFTAISPAPDCQQQSEQQQVRRRFFYPNVIIALNPTDWSMHRSRNFKSIESVDNNTHFTIFFSYSKHSALPPNPTVSSWGLLYV